jgi:hypothetical protein
MHACLALQVECGLAYFRKITPPLPLQSQARDATRDAIFLAHLSGLDIFGENVVPVVVARALYVY